MSYWDNLPQGFEFGTTIANGVNYQIRPADVIWLAVACEGEDSENPQLPAWCMIQRFVARNQGNLERTLQQLVARFSQPVNPAWAYPDNPSRARALGAAPSAIRSASDHWRRQTEHVTATRLRRRRAHINKIERAVAGEVEAWRSIPENVRRCVLDICNGSVGNPIPQYTDFAAAGLPTSAARQALRNNTGVTLGGNIYIKNHPSVRGRTVRIEGRGGNSNQQRALRYPRGSSTPVGGETEALAVASTSITTQGRDSGSAMRAAREPEEGSAAAAAASIGQAAIQQEDISMIDRWRVMPEEDIREQLYQWAQQVRRNLTESGA